MDTLFNAVDCVLIKNPSNLYYFSGYKNSDAIIILTKQKKYYLTDARYLDEAEEILSGFDIVDTKRDIFLNIKTILKTHICKILGIEEDLPLNFYNELLKTANFLDIKNVNEKIQEIRSVKTPKELKLINSAQQITDKSLTDLLPYIKEGVTERTLKRTLENLIYENGGDGLAFDFIVAFGEHTARPHAHADNTKLKNNQLIKIDFGAEYKGYASDMTRMIAFGGVSQEQKNIYDMVFTAQKLALEKAKIGIKANELYHAANDYFVSRGMEKYFLHSLGHGLGRDVHELPALSPRSQQPMKENMVVTIEPGLYFAKKFGVRIEDMIVFEKGGVKNLTKSSKQLIII